MENHIVLLRWERDSNPQVLTDAGFQNQCIAILPSHLMRRGWDSNELPEGIASLPSADRNSGSKFSPHPLPQNNLKAQKGFLFVCGGGEIRTHRPLARHRLAICCNNHYATPPIIFILPLKSNKVNLSRKI